MTESTPDAKTVCEHSKVAIVAPAAAITAYFFTLFVSFFNASIIFIMISLLLFDFVGMHYAKRQIFKNLPA